VTAVLLVLALAASRSGDSTGAILDSLAKAGRALKTMAADFVQTKVTVLLDEKEEASGRILLKIPGRVRWDYLTPQESVMLVKDGSFARYFPKTKQVFRGVVKGEADLLVGFGPGAEGLGKKYDVTLAEDDAVGGRPAYVLDLKPRGAQAASSLFTGIRLWVDKERSIPSQTRLTEPTSDYSTIRFDHVVVNGHLPSDAFDLKLPKGVDELR
jgi:outer membrane lipoprotein-sorting protein